MSQIEIGEDVNKAGKNEAKGAEHQEQTKVSLPTLGDSLRLIKVEVIGKEDRKQCDAHDFEQPVFIDELDVSIGPEEISCG
jgi:hypothetical protein